MDAYAVQQAWHDRTGAYSPGYYAYYGPNEVSEAIRSVFDRSIDQMAAILELGCSSGRHLAHLYNHGYRNLAGIDINHEARSVMEETYPDLASTGTFYFEAIEEVITEFEDGAFDAVYTVETLQHIHPDHAWVFEEIARITDLLVTAELEPGETDAANTSAAVSCVDGDVPLYRRDWADAFTELGFEQRTSRQVHRDTLRVFRATDG